MAENNVAFEKALRKKYRFPTARGLVSVEDLWDIPLRSRDGFDLDVVAKGLNGALKTYEETSFVTPVDSRGRSQVQEQLDIVVHIINVKLAEEAAVKDAAAKADERRRLTEILHIRNQEELMKLDPEEIKARLAKLDE